MQSSGEAAAGSLSCVPEPFLMQWKVQVSPGQSLGAQHGAVGSFAGAVHLDAVVSDWFLL